MNNQLIQIMMLLFCLLIIKLLYSRVSNHGKYRKNINSDGSTVHVLQSENFDDAVSLLNNIANSAETLVDHVSKKYPNHSGAQLLRKRFNKNNIYEGSPSDKDFTYTENKGTRIVICLRNKKMNFHDKNLVMFPLIHELGHMCDKDHDPGHGESFSKCFRFLLDEAIKLGVYQSIDFVNDPKPYCGMVISTNPL
jgi:hypothetical protein